MESSTRKILFMSMCLPIRLAISYLPLSKFIQENKSRTMITSIIFFMIALGFLYLYFTNGRLQSYESGGETWWANIRPLHGLLYLIAGGLLFTKNYKYASFSLLADVLVGLTAFISHEML